MVPEVDIYKSEPWELADYTSVKSRDLEWYFFTSTDKKYANSSRVKRSTERGYWKETGKIQEINHKSEKIGQKKTLVFHSGRAPHGIRTNWVMHEYKLLDQQLQTTGVAQDAFVLCRIFEKSGIGPPLGDCYGPFFEEEREEEESLIVPGRDTMDDIANDDETCAERNNTMQMDAQMIPVACKKVRSENGVLNSELELETLTLFHHKTSKGSGPNSSNANGSQDSTMSSQGQTTTNLLSALVTTKETHPPATPPSFDASALEKSLPPGYMELIRDMENKIRDVSMEKDALKIELMQAQTTINVLHSHIDQLSKENTELKRGV
ncbi:unnamed protein product [Lactuca virosa]|uniref:NAC domain-containing protein n=1 Tax=Lactuca virosa TaxID=75947 RepID=A0AAU9PWP0_9ASTR|nr:unnamed protein product [Lactuca virosa]